MLWLQADRLKYFPTTLLKCKIVLSIQYRAGDVSERLKIRKELQCHNMSWYLNNILPELYRPANIVRAGPVRTAKHYGAFSKNKTSYEQFLIYVFRS